MGRCEPTAVNSHDSPSHHSDEPRNQNLSRQRKNKKKRGNSEKMKDERTKAKNRKGKLITFSVNQEFWEVEKLWDELFDVSH